MSQISNQEATKPAVEIIVPKEEHISDFAEIMARAFEDDPNVLLQIGKYRSKPHNTAKSFFYYLLTRVFVFDIESSAPFGLTFVTLHDGKTVGGVVAIPSTNLKTYSKAVSKRMLWAMITERLNPVTVWRASKCDAYLEQKREEIMAERGDWVYLYAIGAGIRGKGVGSQTMARLTAQADRSRQPIYLENSKEKNLPFYERHGFRTVERVTVLGKEDGVPLWLMVREPAPVNDPEK
ncbi:N-acetyltransferase [Carpediemonas membranifera]|uniref:N-acetyltransferase n=1 Tax=Carpediemonas membranifera TaxID=201153 RepID=A0A8J6E1C8_9EUKA|nr:N-acetyltransferase [Carpediemonas membranifera]|eukprot:KAG9396189.1 N-acetyltransferase [Carpediemonas membranifera]